MQDCTITLTTTTDEREFHTVRKGKMRIEGCGVRLFYTEENACVNISVFNNEAILERKGDYDLYLTLREGEHAKGVLGFGGSEGEIETYAQKIVYSARKDSVLLSLQYSLLIGGEEQKMKLRLLAK